MTAVVRRTAALLSCVVLCLWSLALVVPEAQASGLPTPTSSSPSSSTTYKTVPSEFSLMISPTRLVVGRADVGNTHGIQVVNRGQAPVSVTVQKRNFTGGSDGSLVFQEKAPYSASDWVSVDPMSFTVAPGATQVVTADITVPANPEPGDHQVALVFLVPAGKTSGNIKINRGIGTPVYITVPGPIDDSASLTDLKAKGFVIGGPVTLTATMNNTGTVHRDFRAPTPLTVRGAGAAAPFPDFTVMRGSTRDISTIWDPPLMCICNPTVTLVDADGTVASSTVRVIVFPLPLLGIIVGALLALLLVIRLTRRRYRASVISAAERCSVPVDSGTLEPSHR